MSTNAILFGALFILAATSLIFLTAMHLRLKRLFRGSDAKSLEGLMQEVVTRMQMLRDSAECHDEYIHALESRLKRQGHGVQLLRFNPFKDVGGTQSFAVAIVNEEGDGVVFSSLYSRERMSVFAKPIKNGTSDIELTEEERTVVDGAQKDAQMR